MSASKIWKIVQPLDTPYAQCGLRSPAKLIKNPCNHCTLGATYETPTPLEFEWEVGADKIGDFVWPGMGRTAVNTRVIDFLVANKVPMVKAGEVEMIQDPKLKRPKNPRRAKPRVWLPYEGPTLVELVVEHEVHILPESTTVVVDTCNCCGRKNRRVDGVESKAHRWSPEIMDLVPHHVPRVPGRGLFFSSADVGAVGMFRVCEFSALILCTDDARALLRAAKFTNLDFVEYGDVV